MRDGDWGRDLRQPQRLEQYAEDKIHCLTLKSAGLGLGEELEAATTVGTIG